MPNTSSNSLVPNSYDFIEQDISDSELEQKRTRLQTAANDIILIAEHQTNSALNCLHKIQVLGGTTEKAYQAVQQRIVTDGDIHGAYHAVAMVQQTPDLPFDVPKLVEMVLDSSDSERNPMLLRLLKLFAREPLTSPPIPELKQAIEATGDTHLITQLQQHLDGR